MHRKYAVSLIAVRKIYYAFLFLRKVDPTVSDKPSWTI
jgi:hypothetical protein